MASLAARLSHLLRGRRGSAVVKSHKRFLASRSNPHHVSQRGCRSRALVSSAYDSATLRLFLVQLARTRKNDGQRSLRLFRIDILGKMFSTALLGEIGLKDAHQTQLERAIFSGQDNSAA